MGTISSKIIGKAFLILLSTFFLILVSYLTTSSEKINNFLNEKNIAEILYYIIISTMCIISYTFNNKMIKIIDRYLFIYLFTYLLIIILSLEILYYFSVFVFLILFIYIVFIKLKGSFNLKYVIIANIFTLAISVLMLVQTLNDTRFDKIYPIAVVSLLAFSYFGIFHFLLVLLNIKTLSKIEEEKQIQ
ncbi:hypothetical protein QFZ37_001569 [Chryseobacterium ginsenosidimutans]|uniref:hypothetical protein n=1 Tax=Chryseobacterium ginsenosidimutans TaxID=687846 RepID=UPI002789BA9A|nr:hypothetical protein [Chryseobacterium ginsenosidimutans]MDQ0593200.1 hypothetical protein [Chryseobacterium ginsenosidimutans]